MNELTIFNNDHFGQLRTVMINNQPWFVAADVCRALEIDDTGRAVGRLDQDESTRIEIAHPQNPLKTLEVLAVSEPGLYSLVLGSRKPEARMFKRWITHDVIPAIRSHGGYLTPELTERVLTDPDTIIRLATDLKQERSARIEAERRIAKDAPKVLFADAVSQTSNEILVGELAKMIRQNGHEIGQNRLYEQLRKDGYIMKNSTIPTQRAMELQLFRIIERSVIQPNGTTRVTQTTKVTGKGQVYFINKYGGGEGFLPDLL